MRLRLGRPDPQRFEAVRRLPFVRSAERDPAGDGAWIVELEDPTRDRPALAASVVEGGGELLEISEVRRSLEDLYLELMREDGG